jgi:hypothetical protein
MGKAAGIIPIVDSNPSATSALQIPEAQEWFGAWAKKTNLKNEVTLKT